MIDVTKADLTGRGYRCTPCSVKASVNAIGGSNDVSDHLTPEERKERHAAAGQRILTGAALAGAGGIVFLSMSGLIGIIMVCAGLGTASHGLLTRREMKGEQTK